MPDFTVEAWSTFKQQFLSVLQFVMYCFDLCFDTFRSNPLLYIAFFFPVFALAFVLIFDMFTGVIPFKGSSFNNINVSKQSLIHSFKGVSGNQGTIKSKNLAVRNSEKSSNNVVKAANNSSLVSVSGFKSDSAGSSVNLTGIKGSSSDYGKAKGYDFSTTKRKYNRLWEKLKEWNNQTIYKDEIDSNDSNNLIGPKPYSSDISLKQWLPAPKSNGNINANLDIDVE